MSETQPPEFPVALNQRRHELLDAKYGRSWPEFFPTTPHLARRLYRLVEVDDA